MARIVLGLGTSHTPLLALSGHEWALRAADDLKAPELNLSDGSWVSYDELNATVLDRYADVATPEVFERKSTSAQAALDRLADEIEAADPQVVVIVGDDQDELYSKKNMPAVALYYGDEIITHEHEVLAQAGTPAWAEKVTRGWAVDKIHRFPGAPELALELIEGLLARDVDIGACGEVEDPAKAGFGHAYGFVLTRLFRKSIPVVPILLNTYYPPNVLSPRRCVAIGRALREAIESSKSDVRVAIVASGGLSHFVVDEELDKFVLEAFETGNVSALETIPRGALNGGSSEILNWVMTAGAIEHLRPKWMHYVPVQRTPAGTGIGMAFGAWTPTGEQ